MNDIRLSRTLSVRFAGFKFHRITEWILQYNSSLSWIEYVSLQMEYQAAKVENHVSIYISGILEIYMDISLLSSPTLWGSIHVWNDMRNDMNIWVLHTLKEY